ncbi:predicted protein [Postia placenta Mad-698-R]|nr:predicted protein [Postia placenta Mad-698-R]
MQDTASIAPSLEQNERPPPALTRPVDSRLRGVTSFVVDTMISGWQVAARRRQDPKLIDIVKSEPGVDSKEAFHNDAGSREKLYECGCSEIQGRGGSVLLPAAAVEFCSVIQDAPMCCKCPSVSEAQASSSLHTAFGRSQASRRALDRPELAVRYSPALSGDRNGDQYRGGSFVRAVDTGAGFRRLKSIEMLAAAFTSGMVETAERQDRRQLWSRHAFHNAGLPMQWTSEEKIDQKYSDNAVDPSRSNVPVASKKSTIANGGTETRAHRHTEGKGTPGTIGDWSLSLHTGEQEIGSAIQKRVAARGMA